MRKKSIEDGMITISAVPSCEYLMNGILNKLYVMFEIKINRLTETKERKRTPIELAMVLDRSGSMGGDKIRYSKDAINMVIDNLHEEDKLHLVIYDDQVDVIFKDGKLQNKNILKKQVNEIQARSMTNLGQGVITGHEQIDVSKANMRTKRVFLFSDGLANVGAKSISQVSSIIREIYSKGINVSAFGIGDNFSEEMMQAIAEHGMGDYFYIDTPDSIPGIVEEGLEGLLTIICSNSMLRVRGINGATVTKIFNYDITGATLGDLKESETRQMLVEVEVKPEQLNDDNEFLSYQLEYHMQSDLMSKKKHESKISIEKTDDESKLLEENDEVLVIRKLLEAAEMENRTIELIDNHRYNEAITLQTRLIANLEKIKDRDSKGIVQLKLELANQSLESFKRGQEMGDMRMSRKMAHYSSYQTTQSKSRRRKRNEDEDEI